MKTISISDLNERINEILRLIKEEGETIALTDQGEVVAQIVPVSESEQQTKNDNEFWENLHRITSELAPYWPERVNAVDIVRDIRQD